MDKIIKLTDAIPIRHPVMYDRFLYKDREYLVWAVYSKHIDGRAVKIDGKRQSCHARIDEVEWL